MYWSIRDSFGRWKQLNDQIITSLSAHVISLPDEHRHSFKIQRTATVVTRSVALTTALWVTDSSCNFDDARLLPYTRDAS